MRTSRPAALALEALSPASLYTTTSRSLRLSAPVSAWTGSPRSPRLRSTTSPSLLPRLSSRSLHTSESRNHASSSTLAPAEPMPDISMEETYDIVIIGGGPAGLALACAIQAEPALQDTKVLLLEGGSLAPVRGWTESEWSNRVSSLTSENIAWLEQIGGWKHVAQRRSWGVEEMVIWANPTATSTPTIHFPPLGHPMARMTENINLQRGLLRAIEAGGGGGVTMREGARVGEMRMGPGGGWVGLKVGQDWVRGSLVIGADGPNSPVRHFANISTYGHAYDTHAVVATLLHSPPFPYRNTTAFQRFLPTGPLAFLPLAEEVATMVWSTTPELAAAYKKLPNDALVALINVGFGASEKVLRKVNELVLAGDKAGRPVSRDEIDAIVTAARVAQEVTTSSVDTAAELDVNSDVGGNASLRPPEVHAIPPTSVAGFPLRLSHADKYTSHRLALLGDAAHTVHPLAGQGLNMGLADARSLVSTLAKARTVGSDLGSITALAPYPRERYPANHVLLSATDKLNWVFKSRGWVVDGVRGMGLDVINELGWVKRAFMGAAGAQPGVGEASAVGAGVGAGVEANVGSGKVWDRFGRSSAGGKEEVKAQGWPAKVADGLEGWIQVKAAASMATEVVGAGIGNGLRRFADSLQRR